jgi:hypothetical protein
MNIIILFTFILILLYINIDTFENYESKNFKYIDDSIFINNKIVVSMTTSPKRIDGIKPLIDLISNQTIVPSVIVINLPFIFKRTNMTFTKIPDFILDNPLIYINRCEDIGPSTKIVPTAYLFNDPEIIIISVDDDIIYKNNFIETLLKYSKLSPDSVITGQSFMRIDKPNNSTELKYAQLVEGYSSVLYKKKHFDNFDIKKLLEYPKVCYFADDLILSNYLIENNIDIIVTNELKDNEPYDIIYTDLGNGEDALKNGADGNTNGNIDNYKQCSSYLESIKQLFIKYIYN